MPTSPAPALPDSARSAPHGRLTRLAQLYYLATPLFWLADRAWGLNVRAAFLDELPAARTAYYLLCCALGVAAWRRPRHAALIAFSESAANVFLLAASVVAWYVHVLDWAAAETAGELARPGPAALSNFVLTAAMAGVSFARSEVALRLGARRPGAQAP
jgi:hypothetical protein